MNDKDVYRTALATPGLLITEEGFMVNQYSKRITQLNLNFNFI